MLVTQDQVIIAGSDSMTVYSDLTLRVRGSTSRSKRRPAIRYLGLKYAETLFAAGQIEPAVQKLDEAINLLGGVTSMCAGPERDRVRSLVFAECALNPKVGAHLIRG